MKTEANQNRQLKTKRAWSQHGVVVINPAWHLLFFLKKKRGWVKIEQEITADNILAGKV